MGELGRILLELADRAWAELTPDEQAQFDRWLGVGPCAICGAPRPATRGVDVYTLLRFDRRRRRPSSTSQTLAAQHELAEPAELQGLRERVAELEAERELLKKQLRRYLRKDSDER